MDYIPTRRLLVNKFFTISAVMAHNLLRQLQTIAYPPDRNTSEKCSSLWEFEKA